MLVSQAIELLTKYYKPEDEIILTWYDKEWAESFIETELDNEKWSGLVHDFEASEEGLGEVVAIDLRYLLDNQ